MAIRIIAVRKPGGFNLDPHEAIQSVKWTDESTGETKVSTREAVYEFLKRGGKAFVKDAYRDVVSVMPRVNALGTKFIQTQADSTWRDNLLYLPSF